MTRKRRDDNQAELVRQLRKIPGVSVEPSLADLGKGLPDIMVGFHGRTWLFEVKDPSKSPSRRRLTGDEQDWHDAWTGHVDVAETLDDVLQAIGWQG